MNRLDQKIRVEPLTPDRLARVEEQVVQEYLAAEPRRPRRRWPIMAAVAAVPMAAAAAVLLWVVLGASEPAPMALGEEPTRIETTDTTRIDLGDATIEAAPDTVFDIRRTADGIDVDLAQGTVDCTVEPIPGRPAFAVHAADVDVTVVGTIFQVVRDGDEVRVSVTRGEVTVDAPGQTLALMPGESYATPKVASADTPHPDPPRASRASRGAEESRATRANGGKAPEAERTDTALDTDTDRRVVKRSVRRDRKRDAGARLALTVAPAPELAPIVDPPAGGYDFGKRQHVYSKAVSQHRSRDRRGALQTIDYFTTRFTKGAFTEEILELRILISCTKASAACRKAAHAYLGSYPDGDYRDHARALTNWM